MNSHPEIGDHLPSILIVDDERANRQLLEVMLMPEGFELRSASGGEDALAMVSERPPDLILLDVMMPGMNGYQLARAIKGGVATKSIPVIIITALHDREARMLGLSAGAEDFLTKPVDRAELCARVRNLLRLKAFGDYHSKHSQELQGEVQSRTTELVESERLYRSTFDAAPVGIVHLGLNGRWLRVNQRLCQLLGYSREELQTGRFAELLSPEGACSEAQALHQLEAGELDRQVIDEQQYRRRDGVIVWARVNMSIHRDAGGQPQHFILVVEEITERRALESRIRHSIVQLTASEARYRTLLDNANDAIAVLTPEGVVLEMNQRWAEITGRPTADLIGRHVRDFAATGKEAVNIQAYHEAMATNGNNSAPVAIATREGAVVFMEFSHARMDFDGQPLVFTIGRDVTNQRQLEERLRHAQKLEVIGQLAAGIAHDFNNLLSAILGFSEILIEDLDPDAPGYSDAIQIRKAGERAAGLTQQLLAFGRKQILQPVVLDINELITVMEPLLRRLIFEHVELVTSLASDVGPVRIDATQFEQVIVNLAVNAADAMPQGGRLTIETAAVVLDENYRQHHLPVTPGDYVMLAVSDTGAGMDEATSRRIFEPFFTTKEVGKGTGLGLATVYGIVKQSGGDILVHSEPGRGATFKIYLPQVASTSVPEFSPCALPAEIPPVSETVLLVEDDEVVRQIAHLILERAGYRVVAAENPKEALRVAEEFVGSIDLLLSDVIMPESGGPPLLLRLRATRPGLRVLYMSGYADEAIVRQGVLVEGTPFLQKPFTPQSLSRKVREVLDAPASAQSACPTPAHMHAVPGS